MAARRLAIGIAAAALAIALPACKFSRSSTNTAAPSDTTESTVEVLGDVSTIPDDSSTTLGDDTTTSRRPTTTAKPATATTAAAVRTATTPRPPAPTTPHCDVSVPNTTYGSTWTATVTSSFANSNVVIDLSWPGGSGNYSGNTDGSGSWVKTQRVQPSMRGQRVAVTASVGGRTCSTSFTVS
jgi:hypothetical protein